MLCPKAGSYKIALIFCAQRLINSALDFLEMITNLVSQGNLPIRGVNVGSLVFITLAFAVPYENDAAWANEGTFGHFIQRFKCYGTEYA